MNQPPHTEIMSATFTTAGRGPRKFCGPVNDYGLEAICYGWPYEWQRQERVMRVVARGGSFLDIGAHIGTDTVPLSDWFARGLAFEPNALNFACLCYNLEANGVTHVTPRHAALSRWAGRAALHLAGPGLSVAHSLNADLARSGQAQIVDVLTLDGLDVTDCTFIHVDAEGHDLLILDGGMEFIRRQAQPPVICLEFAPRLLAACGSTLDGLVKLVGEGFVLYEERADLMAPTSMANVAEHWRLWQRAPIWLNLWLVPKGLSGSYAFPEHPDA